MEPADVVQEQTCNIIDVAIYGYVDPMGWVVMSPKFSQGVGSQRVFCRRSTTNWHDQTTSVRQQPLEHIID